MKRIILVMVVAILSVLMMGCGHANPVLPITQAASGVSATLVMDPYPLVQLEESILRLTLKDANNLPVSGADVRLDLS